MIGTTAKGVKLRNITNLDDLCGLPEKADVIHEWLEMLIPRPTQMRPLALQVPSGICPALGENPHSCRNPPLS